MAAEAVARLARQVAPVKRSRPLVVLLHGLGRTGASMAGLAAALEVCKFDTELIDYPSLTQDLPSCAADIAADLKRRHGTRRISAVTHSLGGIMVRLMNGTGLRWRRIVMLAPPNQGSGVARALGGVTGLSKVFGAIPAASALTNGKWPYPPAPFAVIAGTRHLSAENPTSWLSHLWLTGEHDGTVTVKETRLRGMAAFRKVDVSHSTIMDNLEVQRLVISFLRHGKF